MNSCPGGCSPALSTDEPALLGRDAEPELRALDRDSLVTCDDALGAPDEDDCAEASASAMPNGCCECDAADEEDEDEEISACASIMRSSGGGERSPSFIALLLTSSRLGDAGLTANVAGRTWGGGGSRIFSSRRAPSSQKPGVLLLLLPLLLLLLPSPFTIARGSSRSARQQVKTCAQGVQSTRRLARTQESRILLVRELHRD